MTRFPVPDWLTATKRANSGAQQTELQATSAAEVRVVHVMPLGLVMTRFPVPESLTATNNVNSGDQQSETHVLSAADARDVHVIPSKLVMTRLPVPVLLTAANNISWGAQQIEYQSLSTAEVRDVHTFTAADAKPVLAWFMFFNDLTLIPPRVMTPALRLWMSTPPKSIVLLLR